MKPKILIVDDEYIITFTLQKLLSEEGYEVFVVNNISAAKEMFSQKNFDLILADIILGFDSGLEILKKIKENKLTSPVIFITGYPTIETASEAVRMGAYDYLPKPIKNETLLRTIKKALEHKRVVDENIKYRLNLEAILKSIKDAIITVNKERVIVELNKTAEDICGFPSNDETKGKKFDSLLNKCSGKCLDALTETVNTTYPAEIIRFECNNNLRPRQVVSIATHPLFDVHDTFNGCVLVVKDETHVVALENDLQQRQELCNLIGKSPEMKKVYSFIEALSNIQTTVLITGESGTGKGLAAEALHHYKQEYKKPFVVVNCAALSDNLLESELFGHVKGAYTGAVSDRAGRFQMADGGTIFLDEIGDISETMQLRLLRVLQDMEFERVGDSTPLKVNVRIIAATNQDLRKKVKNKTFREDLYYRLKVAELAMPALRYRQEDIPLLVEHFINKYNNKFNKNIKSLSSNVLKLFMDYNWPGNVREMSHILEYAFAICNDSIITLNYIPNDLKNICPDKTFSSGKVRKDKDNEQNNDRNLIVQTLGKTGGNKSKAAQLLGINRRTLYNKMKKYGLLANGSIHDFL
ncbi:MAG: sigma 54-interacting transcriptional regulator [Candidatus Kuenenia sp.]|nr:sigma 54-interacting transcriptional regulator [Candidatus Kuenenia hertensis]